MYESKKDGVVRMQRRWHVTCNARTKRVGCNVDRPSDDDPAVVIRSRCISGVDIENGNETWGNYCMMANW